MKGKSLHAVKAPCRAPPAEHLLHTCGPGRHNRLRTRRRVASSAGLARLQPLSANLPSALLPAQQPSNMPRAVCLTRVILVQVVSTATGSGNPFEQLYRSLFWVAMLLALVTALQLAALAFFMYQRARRPPLVAFPRPQLFVVMLGIPALIAAAAGKPASACSLSAAGRLSCKRSQRVTAATSRV